MGESVSDGRFNCHPPNEATCVWKGKCQDFEVSAVRVQVPVAPGTSPVSHAVSLRTVVLSREAYMHLV